MECSSFSTSPDRLSKVLHAATEVTRGNSSAASEPSGDDTATPPSREQSDGSFHEAVREALALETLRLAEASHALLQSFPVRRAPVEPRESCARHSLRVLS